MIPAYQAVDLLFKGGVDLPKPRPGWVICFPDSGLQAEMREGEVLSEKWATEQAKRSK